MAVSQRGIKQEILTLLSQAELNAVLTALAGYSPEKLLNPLFSAICSASEKTKWNAVSAMGATVSRLADQDMEAARIVMRRFMWSLNDESGGIGWGTPEAMAECLVCHKSLAQEYTKILVSFMREDGFYLELPALQRGLMWGLGRLAQARPELLRDWQAPRYLLPYLDSEDPIVRALAARALGLLQVVEAAAKIKQSPDDTTEFSLYVEHRLTTVTAGQLAREALAALAPVLG
ncbi:MAG: HEAT repeat domain-containing protein [Deltaproteobacteria bacterium]|nr:HEAT repeat domain-containing protein [Deltaproteobacteria bacterium]